ncbi:MAG TPA: glycerophosphodiester phosphodiesterase [Acidimicrobiia bacterium]|nr:glycerophosphodiester phosphodiesterase [Acidimicrobiia bacterium]
MKPFLTHEHPIRFAHRGSTILWPENTMPAFQGAVDLGYRYLELDVHVSRDGAIVVFHDDRLDRLTDGTGKVWDHTWAELRALDAAHNFDPDGGHPLRGTGIRMPLLEELALTFPDAMFNIDLKQRGIEEPVASLIARLRLEERVLIGSFRDWRIGAFRRLTHGRVAVSAGPREITRAVAACRLRLPIGGSADALQIPRRVASRRLVDSAHSAGKQVHVWTVNDPDRMRTLLDMEVDGIITDRPDLLNEVVFGQRRP